jgi:Copper transport outer membrane protein, MctB
MINFRFHLVSIIAVFLALALGIAMGATVISQGIVDTLEERIDTVEDNADEINADNDDLGAENQRLREYMEATASYSLAGRLQGAAVVVVAARGVDGSAVQRTVELAQTAGGDAPGTLWLEESWGLIDADQVEAMAMLLGASRQSSRSELRREAWNALAQRLAAGPPPYGGGQQAPTGPDGTDLLVALEGAGFVSYQSIGDDTAITEIPDGNRALLVDGTNAEIAPDDVVVRGAKALLAEFPVVVVAEVFDEQDDGPDRGERVAPVRDDDVLADAASTVDDLDLAEGPMTAVLVLADTNTVGHYGYGDGNQGRAPELSDS